MKRILLIIVIVLQAVVVGFAQTTMDELQILQYISTQHEAGKSNNEIAVELVKRGVTLEQIQQIKAKYDRQGKNGAIDLFGETDAATRQESRLRNKSGVSQRRRSSTVVNSMSKKRRKEYDNEMVQGLALGLDAFSPDSTHLIDEQDMFMEYDKPMSRIFGHDIFNNEKLTFEPDENVATPGDYRLGAGDNVYIDVWGASQATFNGTISPDGIITIEDFGPVTLGGMTVDEANTYLGKLFASVYADSNVRVTVGQTRTIGVNVMGEVQVPGTYTLSAFATAFHALYAAGGINDIGTLRGIMIYRSGRKVAEIDVYDYIMNGKTMDDIRLETGDVIYVGPYHSLVDIEGKVKRPMFYEMKQNETLATLLGFAGNFSGNAYKSNIRVIRKNGYDYTVYTVNEFDYPTFRMLDGDSVTVDSTIARFSNMVEVRGAVYRPGMYQMDGNMKTVRSLLTSIDGPKEEALKGRAVIYRMREDRSREVKSFNLEEVMNGTASDIPLRNEDIIHVFDQEDTKTGRTLTIYGAVNFPGVYDFAAGTSIEDLILQAGGLTDDASLLNVEVSRRNLDKNASEQGNTIAQMFTFDLTDGFAVMGAPSFTLMPYDEVFVRRSPTWSDERIVRVDGEVNFAGEFALQRKNERLSDIVKRAGGLTDYAYVQGAHLQRTMNDDEMERKRALVRLSQSKADPIDKTSLDVSSTYTVGINLKAALDNPGGVDDIILSSGDRLVIPGLQNLVKVNGAVMYPNAVAWQDGKKAKYYINLAGGYNSRAKKRKAFVVSLDGTVHRAKKVKKILPGSEIVIPTKPDNRRLTTGEIAAIGTSAASLATMIATIANLLK